MFFLKKIFFYSKLFAFLYFKTVSSISTKKSCSNFDWDYIEPIDQFGGNWQRFDIKMLYISIYLSLLQYFPRIFYGFQCIDLPHFLFLKKFFWGAPGWLSRLSVWLWLRSWSHGLWVWAPRRALCWQLRAWGLFTLCLFLSQK